MTRLAARLRRTLPACRHADRRLAAKQGGSIVFTRRTFLQSSLVALAPTVPLFVARSASAAEARNDQRVLVVVQLDGGNDALNTVVPFGDPEYAKLRPKLNVDATKLLKLDESLGLHPSLKPLDRLWQGGELAVVPGVGYPNPNRSHFESMAIWHTARLDRDDRKGYGWIGRALDPSAGTACAVGGSVPPALRGRRSVAVALNRADEVLLSSAAAARRSVGPEPTDDLLAFVRRQAVEGHSAAEKVAKLAGTNADAEYPSTGLAERLRLVARLLKADLGSRVFYTVQTGYDTHAGQQFPHSNLLSEFGGAVAAFFADLKAAKLAERVTLLAFSEFGRTIKENGSGGTDHGTAGAVFVAGPGVKGGVVGTVPSLTDLVGGEPKPTADFRGLYAAVLADWLELPADTLGTSVPAVRLFGRT
jgi:uncharacterized protein (DUF1501 family)